MTQCSTSQQAQSSVLLSGKRYTRFVGGRIHGRYHPHKSSSPCSVRPAATERNSVDDANFTQVAGISIHEAISTSSISQGFGFIGQNLSAGAPLVAGSSGKLAQDLGIKNSGRVDVLGFSVCQHTMCFLTSGLGKHTLAPKPDRPDSFRLLYSAFDITLASTCLTDGC
jgi:hypothetical protein